MSDKYGFPRAHIEEKQIMISFEDSDFDQDCPWGTVGVKGGVIIRKATPKDGTPQRGGSDGLPTAGGEMAHQAAHRSGARMPEREGATSSVRAPAVR